MQHYQYIDIELCMYKVTYKSIIGSAIYSWQLTTGLSAVIQIASTYIIYGISYIMWIIENIDDGTSICQNINSIQNIRIY